MLERFMYNNWSKKSNPLTLSLYFLVKGFMRFRPPLLEIRC